MHTEATDAEVAAFVTRLYDGTATDDDRIAQHFAVAWPGHLPWILGLSAEDKRVGLVVAMDRVTAAGVTDAVAGL